MKFKELANRQTKRALITGGSSGIGRSFSIELAKAGFDLTILARRITLLHEIQSSLKNQYHINVDVHSIDLSKPNWRAELNIDKFEYELVVNCAGDGYPGSFGSKELDFDRGLIQLNCSTPMEITHEVLPHMKENGGGIIYVSSTMGFLGIPMMANYSASKSYLTNFGEALYHELKEHNMAIQVLTPGATKTPALDKHDVNYESLPVKWMNPEEVVQQSLKNLGSKPVVIPGWTNWLTAGMSSCILTRNQIQKIMKKYSKSIIGNSNKQ